MKKLPVKKNSLGKSKEFREKQEELVMELRQPINTERIKNKIKEIKTPIVYKARKWDWKIKKRIEYETTKKPRDYFYSVQ